MSKEAEIKEGDYVQVVVSVWTESETPSVKNFYEGKITEIVERATNCFYVKVAGLDRLIPIDRVSVA